MKGSQVVTIIIQCTFVTFLVGFEKLYHIDDKGERILNISVLEVGQRVNKYLYKRLWFIYI